MRTPTLLALIVASAISGKAYSAIITGKVTNERGEPVAGAKVTIEGKQQPVFTDAKGLYRFDNVDKRHIHLHVYSSEYIHGDNDLGVIDGDENVDFVLSRSSVENIVVTASAMEASVLESVTPVSVLGEEQLRKIEAPTLGETLKSTPGVHSTYFGPVSSSPVIRGNDGPRVKIVQNGLNVSDVSRIGPDHNVTGNTSSANQIEVLRGPATLQYGSGAIGGVVNIVDNRMPSDVPLETNGEAQLSYSTVNNEKYARGEVNGGGGNIAWHIDGFSRDTDNADIPGYASAEPDDDEPFGVLESSSMDTASVVAGLSYIGDEGFVGFSVEQLDNRYGVPGHAHHQGHEDEHVDEHEAESEEEHEAHGDEGVLLDVDMTRYQSSGEWLSPVDGIAKVKFGAAYTDYTHSEIEDGEVGTIFNNDATNLRLSVFHEDFNGWHGVLGTQFDQSDYEAIGAEAFSPPTKTTSTAVYLIEQKKVGEITFELGGRLEYTRFEADDSTFELDVAHDEGLEEEHHEEHEEEHVGEHEETALNTFSFDEYSFTSTSFSAGMNWEYQPGHALAVTLSRSERAPSQQELFAAGQHLATRSFEVGLVYQLDQEGEVGDTLQSVDEEVSNNLDITLRKFTGDWGYTVSLFYNKADDYIYQSATGLTALDEAHEEEEHAEAGHDEPGHDEEAHADEEGLPVYAFRQADADIWGLEAETYYDLNATWRITAFSDYIRAEIDSQDLPRTPPLRVGTSLNYQSGGLSGELGVTWYDEQDQVAPLETPTDGYTLLNASMQYELRRGGIDWILFARGDNLTDQEARVHTSFLKDQAPLPGRNITLGVRALF